MAIMTDAQTPRGVLVPQLAAWRKYRALTQKELAAKAQTTRLTVARAEAGNGIDAVTVRKLAKALHISIAALHAAPPTQPPQEPTP